MKHFQQLIKDKRGVALFIVLTSMATLAIFLGEITYTAQINQKLAYDRLDNVKATALAKSGMRLALLRIRAYFELKKIIKDLGGEDVAPKEMIEKVWNEPITIPFTGDLTGLPTSLKDSIEKFRSESGLEGKLYISVHSQSSKFNLNSYLSPFAPQPGKATGSPTPAAMPSSSPVVFNAAEARELLTQQITQTIQNKFDEDEKFRDIYRNLRISDIADDIMSWNDLSYDSLRSQSSDLPLKRAPFYDISELHFLPTMDDALYDLLAPAYSTTVNSKVNVNKILEPALAALIPVMTKEERKKFFEFRDKTGSTADAQDNSSGSSNTTAPGGLFKDAASFYDYLSKNVSAFNTPTKIQEFKDNLVKRGLVIDVDESQFLVHIEATVHQTKKTMEAIVEQVQAAPLLGNTPPTTEPSSKNSSLKVMEMRFL
jgi:type II secretory pathway component PulK